MNLEFNLTNNQDCYMKIFGTSQIAQCSTLKLDALWSKKRVHLCIKDGMLDQVAFSTFDALTPASRKSKLSDDGGAETIAWPFAREHTMHTDKKNKNWHLDACQNHYEEVRNCISNFYKQKCNFKHWLWPNKRFCSSHIQNTKKHSSSFFLLRPQCQMHSRRNSCGSLRCRS